MAKKGGEDANLDDPREAVARDGGILGDPRSRRYATGKPNVDVTEAGAQMLRGRHAERPRDGR